MRTTGRAPAFLTAEKYEEFLKPDRFVARSIAEVGRESGRANVATRTDLITHVTTRLHAISRREGSSFESVCIRVRRGDGMSWSAEAVRAALREQAPHFTTWAISNRTIADGMPIMAKLIGLRAFLRLAAQHKLTRSFVTLRWWLAPALVGVVIAGGALGRIMDGLLKAETGSAPTVRGLLSDWTFLAYTIGAAAVALGAQQLTTFLTTRTESESLKTFRQDLESKERSQEYDEFVEALASRLAGSPFPRFVIIDDFEALDPATARTVLRYFQTHRESAQGSEFWIVFERDNGERFTSRLIAGRASSQPSPVSIFEQLEITNEQKTALIRMLNRPARAADFTAVKPICEDDKEGAERWKAIFAQYRPPGRPRPVRYDDLDFLYLLSLTAEPGDVSLGTDDIVSTFARKDVERARVLQQVLPGAELKPAELRSAVQQVDQRFEGALIFAPDRRHRRVTLEAAEALRSMPEGDVPAAALGHFFWALFWHDRFGPRVRQAFWMRKLAYHARAMDFSAMRLADSDPLQRRAFDLLLVTAEGCLKTGIFAEVVPLLRKATDVLQADAGAAELPRQRQLLRMCWEAYWVLGDPELIAMASEVYEFLGGDGAPTDASPTALGQLFLETVSIQAGTASVRAMADRLSGGAAEVSESVFDYLRVRSAWFALTSAAHLTGLGLTELLRAALETLDVLDALGRRAWERLAQPGGVPRVADGLTLSLALWASALRTRWSTLALLALSNARGPQLLEEVLAHPHSADRTVMSRVIEMSRNAVLVAGQMTGQTPTGGAASRETDFPLSGAIHELCAVAVASIVASAHWLSRHGNVELSPEELGQVADIFGEVNQIIGATLPAVSSNIQLRSSELRTAIDRLLLGCEILWQTFELPQLRDTLGIRRAQFEGMCIEITLQNIEAHIRSAQASRGLEAEDLLGLMANLTVADRLGHVESLATFYLARAGRIALHGRFGPGLRQQLAFMVIIRARAAPVDLTEFVEELLGPDGTGSTGLARLLAGLTAEAFCGAALRFLEVAQAGAPTAQLEARVRAALVPAVENLPDSERAEAEALLDVSALRDQLRQGERVSPVSIIEAWRHRRHLWTYAWVLELLLNEGHQTTEALSESLALIRRDASLDQFSTYFFLALRLGQSPQGERVAAAHRELGEAAFAYLTAGHPRWEPSLTPVVNLRVFQVLERLDPDNHERYRVRRAQWEYLKVEFDHQQRLPVLLDQKRFFDVFLDYWLGMSDWGLPTDESAFRDLGIERFNAPAEERRRIVGNWLHGGGKLPPPWGIVQGRRAVSGAFVFLGQFVFSPPLIADADLADVRRMFNDAAYSALPDLFRMVVALPRLPTALKELVGRFEGRFQQHASPDLS